jgi:hypothetical protein
LRSTTCHRRCAAGRSRLGTGYIARADQSSHDSWRRRAQLVQQIEVFNRLADRAGSLPDLARWFCDLADVITQRWTDATTPQPRLFPAFAETDRV